MGGKCSLVPRIPLKANSEGTLQLWWPDIMATNVLLIGKKA